MTSTPPARPRGRGSRAIVAILVAAAATVGVGGCDLRLDGPAPTAPAPDAVEQVRERAVADALGLAQDAEAAAATPEGAAADVGAVLTDVGTFSRAHADALGGTYVSGLETPTPSASAPPARDVSVQQVLDELATTSATALTDADATGDGDLARLLASVGTARDELATRLAAAAHLAAVPPPTATPAASPTPAPSASAASPFPAVDSRAIVLAHDQAGYGFEVIAAKSSGDARTAAVASAAAHRAQAAGLAAQAGIDGTSDDPRRAAYALPAGLDDPAARATLAQSLETAVADAYGAAVAHLAAGARGPAADGLSTATAAARAWGATPVPFPGMPELAPKPAG